MGLFSILFRLWFHYWWWNEDEHQTPARTLLPPERVPCRFCGAPISDFMVNCGSCGKSRIGPPPGFEEQHG